MQIWYELCMQMQEHYWICMKTSSVKYYAATIAWNMNTMHMWNYDRILNQLIKLARILIE